MVQSKLEKNFERFIKKMTTEYVYQKYHDDGSLYGDVHFDGYPETGMKTLCGERPNSDWCLHPLREEDTICKKCMEERS